LLMLILILADMLSVSSRVEPVRLETLLPCALKLPFQFFLHNY
jgi:hypothetical protein